MLLLLYQDKPLLVGLLLLLASSLLYAFTFADYQHSSSTFTHPSTTTLGNLEVSVAKLTKKTERCYTIKPGLVCAR